MSLKRRHYLYGMWPHQLRVESRRFGRRNAMCKFLPLDRRLHVAAQHVVRARLFFDLWFYFEGRKTRREIIETMREYNEFFRFTPHAYLAAYIGHITAMFDRRASNQIRLW